MSVCGVDIGNLTSTVALARRRGVDVILNKESKRETPSMVNFDEKQRFMGTDASAKVMMNPKNTVSQLKRIIGRSFNEPDFAEEVKNLPFSVTPGPDNEPLINVTYLGQPAQFSPQRCLAMQMADLKLIAEADQGSKVTDVVVGVPAFFNEKQRRAMLDATRIAGFNCLRLMNETTATALAYGIFRTDLPEDNPQHVMFVDMGHASLQVCVVAFKKGQLKVLSQAFDRNFGGRDIDAAVFHHIAAEFKEKYGSKGVDVSQNARAAMRLNNEIEKVKKILSINPEAPLNVECLMNDVDCSTKLTREKLEELAVSTFDRFLTPIKTALADAGLRPDEISEVEVVGAASRTPCLVRTLEEFFGKQVARHLNATEAVSRGCALQCAMLSPAFRVREFDVQDVTPYSIAFRWDKVAAGADEGADDAAAGAADGNSVTSVLFPKGNVLPSEKMITFFRSEPFAVECLYADPSQLSAGIPQQISKFEIGKFPVPDGSDKAKLKVKVRLNLHGVVSLDSVQTVVEVEEADPAAAAAPTSENGDKMETDAASGAPAADAGGEAPMEADAGAAAAEAPKKKKKVRREDVAYNAATTGMNAADLQGAVEKEYDMAMTDRIQEETKDKKNELEAYIYSMRNKLCDTYTEYVTEGDKSSFNSKLDSMEDWLYEDGEDEAKGVYVQKIGELKAIGDPIEERYNEAASRPEVASNLQAVCKRFTEMATGSDAAYAHIEQGDKDKVTKECADALMWLQDKLAQQESNAKTAAPVVFTADINRKRETVERFCQPIMSKPKPAPPKEEPKPAATEEKPAAEGDAPMETEGGEAKEGMETANDLD